MSAQIYRNIVWRAGGEKKENFAFWRYSFGCDNRRAWKLITSANGMGNSLWFHVPMLRVMHTGITTITAAQRRPTARTMHDEGDANSIGVYGFRLMVCHLQEIETELWNFIVHIDENRSG